MRINYDVEMPKKERKRKWSEMYNFFRSEHTTVCFEFDDVHTAKKCVTAAYMAKRNHGLKIRAIRDANKVFIQKYGVIAYGN